MANAVFSGLYAWGLRWVTGDRFVLLRHRGRRTGRVYRTLLVGLTRDPVSREITVMEGRPGADWLRNIAASPALDVTIGRERFRPAYRTVTVEEVARALAESRRRHPLVTRVQCAFFGWPWRASTADLVDLARSRRAVAFRAPS